MADNFEQRLSAIEYELSQIAESEYLKELKEKFSGDYGKDVVVNIIPSRDISFKTRSLLSSILDRLELTHQDRLDLEKYIVYGGGDNIEYLKETLAVWVEWKDKILNILQDSPEEFDSLIEIFNYINNHITESNVKLEEINNNILELNEKLNNKAEKTDIVQADYIENDISNKSYIINKPCSIDYITISDNPVISDMSVSGFENSETYEVSQQYNKYMNIIGLCVAKDNGYNEVIYVPIKYGTVNTFYHQAYDDGSFQIYIYIDAVYGPLGVGQIKVRCSHKITKIIGVAGFNKINENFIPTTIARQSEITRLENRIAELENKLNEITISETN